MTKRLYREFYLLPRGEQRGLILLSLLLILALIFRVAVGLLPERVPEGSEAFEQEAILIRAAFAEADSLRGIRLDSIRQNRAGISGGATPYTHTARKGYSRQPIDINRADSAELLPLPGIGPVFASRLIKYRDLLGGYASVDQLKEVYGISTETIDRITDRIVIDTTLLIKLDLNTATFSELLRHPYLEYEYVKAIVNYRDFKGNIRSLHELQENFILQDSVMKKVIPYFYCSISEAVDLSK